MTGCPVTANVTVLVSAYFEVAQNSNNINYQGGWSLGPRISTEDIFDNLPKINSVQPKAIALGTKNNSNTMAPQMQLKQLLEPPRESLENRFNNLLDQYNSLSNTIKKLKIDIPNDEDFEDEKYFQQSPQYKNLTKSTIDLALSIKDKLTPGSVTSKTIRNNLP